MMRKTKSDTDQELLSPHDRDLRERLAVVQALTTLARKAFHRAMFARGEGGLFAEGLKTEAEDLLTCAEWAADQLAKDLAAREAELALTMRVTHPPHETLN